MVAEAKWNGALDRNSQHLRHLCALFDIGEPGRELERVTGGFHHRMWRLDTSAGRYAIKQFADDMNMDDAATAGRINATEVTAQAFAVRDIPALVSLSCRGQHLQILDNTGYLVFPWTDRKAIRRNDIGEYHAVTVARILARMHHADIAVPGLGTARSWPLTRQRVIDLVTLAQQRNVRDVHYLLARLPDILAVVERQAQAKLTLSRHAVVSHGDLDHKNVLWSDSGEPLLIDWESAGPVNPTFEVLMEAMDWSGITGHFGHGPFATFLSAYVEAGGVIAAGMIPAAFDAILGAWVNWLLFSVGRAAGLEGMRQRAIGSEQIDLAVSTLLRLERNIPRLQDIAHGCAT